MTCALPPPPQLGGVRRAQLPRSHVRGGERKLQHPQGVAGGEPQHPVSAQGGKLLLSLRPVTGNTTAGTRAPPVGEKQATLSTNLPSTLWACKIIKYEETVLLFLFLFVLDYLKAEIK